MGGGASKGIPAGGVSREQLLKSTQPMRMLMDAALQLMLSELAPADLMALGDSGKCSDYAVATGDAFDSYFKSIRVEPLIDKRNPKQGVIYFQDLDVFSGKGLSEAQRIEKKQLCTTLGFFYTRVFQIYAALALTLFDDANIRPTATGIGRRYDILPYGARGQMGPGFGRGPGVAVMRGGAFDTSITRGADGKLTAEDINILGPLISEVFNNFIVKKETATNRYLLRASDSDYYRDFIITLTKVIDPSRPTNVNTGIVQFVNTDTNNIDVELNFYITQPNPPNKIFELTITNITKINEVPIRLDVNNLRQLFGNNFKFKITPGLTTEPGRPNPYVAVSCGDKSVIGRSGFNVSTTLIRSLYIVHKLGPAIRESISKGEKINFTLPSPCGGLGGLDPARYTKPAPVAPAGPTEEAKEVERLKKEAEAREKKHREDIERLERARGRDYDYAASEIRRRSGETDREYIYRLKAYVDTKARGLGWDRDRTDKRIGEDNDDYLRRLEKYVRELRDVGRYDRGYGYGYGSRGVLQRKAGESEYEYQKRVREHYREYYREDDESKAAARIGDVYATLKKGTRPIAHCVARALQLVSFDPSARGGRSYVCNYKFLEPTPTGIPAPGKAISDSVGLKSLSTLFAAFSKGRIVYQDPGRTEYLNFLKGMSEAFGDDPRRVSDSWLPAEGEKSHRPLEKIVNKADAAKCVRQDVIELGGKAYTNAVAASRILMARQVKHARDVEKIFREMFIVDKGVIKIHPQLLALGLPGLDAIATKTRRVLGQYYRECEATYQDAAAAIKDAVKVSTK